MAKLPNPPSQAIIYKDKKVYAALASYPIVDGHIIVVWKKSVRDISLLSCKEYDYLMNVVDLVRDTMLKELKIKKVYLMYMDEIKHVHWHLIPRYNIKGFALLRHKPHHITKFSQSKKLQAAIQKSINSHHEI